MQRRSFLGAVLTMALARPAAAKSLADDLKSDDLELHLLELPGAPELARRAVLLVPKRARRQSSERLLVLLHGLGETNDEGLGLRAWPKLYGLLDGYSRLRRPPLIDRPSNRGWLSEARRAGLNRELAENPFEGFAVACPITPNPWRKGGASALDRYAEWLEKALLPAARQRLSSAGAGPHIGIDGCSLGGYVALEVFLRKPELFATLGGVQSAFAADTAPRYADRLAKALARVGPRAIHLESSTLDPYRKANERLSRELGKRGVKNVLTVTSGPHTQPWLRESGTLEMLVFHDRHLGERS